MNKHDNELDTLVKEMGFNKTEASMALDEAAGDMNKAVENLLAGKFAPPPYQQNEETEFPLSVQISEKNRIDDPSKRTFSNFLDDVRGKHNAPMVEDKPTAPNFSDLSNELNNLELPIGIKQMPPPYEIVEKSHKMKVWERDFNVFYFDAPNNEIAQETSLLSKRQIEQTSSLPPSERCDACFNILETTEDVLSQGRKVYHGKCFRKKYGPKCSHCCFPLTLPDKDHDLSGRYMVYQNKDYHVECYEKYAGPRCSQCFNVIIERSNGEFSGNWIVDGNYQYHAECYQKKLNSQWRVKNS